MPVWSKREFLYLDFRFKSVRFRQSTELRDTQKNKKVVQEWDAAILHEIRLGTFDLARHFPRSGRVLKPPRNRTFAGAAKTWLDSHRGTWAELTYRKFRDDLERRILPELGPLPIFDEHTLPYQGSLNNFLRELPESSGSFSPPVFSGKYFRGSR